MRIITNVIWYGVIFAFWVSLASSGMNIKPYTPVTLGIYYLLIGSLSTIVGFSYQEVADEIRDGKISGAVIRPVNYLTVKFFATASDKVLMIAIMAAVLTVLYIFRFINFGLTPINMTLFAISVLFAMVGNFLLYFLTAMGAFWVKHTHGIPALVSVFSGIASGSMIPIDLLPPTLLLISKILPFRYFTFFPAEIFLGNATFSEIWQSFAIESIWIVLLFVLYKFLWGKGMKQLEVIGV